MGTLRISPDTGVKFDNVAGIDEAKEVAVGEDELIEKRVVVLLPYSSLVYKWCGYFIKNQMIKTVVLDATKTREECHNLG